MQQVLKMTDFNNNYCTHGLWNLFKNSISKTANKNKKQAHKDLDEQIKSWSSVTRVWQMGYFHLRVLKIPYDKMTCFGDYNPISDFW